MNRTVKMNGNTLTLVGPELKVGEKAPDFIVLDTTLSIKTLKDFLGKIKVFSTTPSLDTPVCDMQVKRFNEEASKLSDKAIIINISMDLPFALSRFCTAKGINRVITLSDHREASFGKSYGVLIKELRLLARAVFIVDDNDVIRYIEIVPEVTNHPNYEASLNTLRSLIK